MRISVIHTDADSSTLMRKHGRTSADGAIERTVFGDHLVRIVTIAF